MRCPVTVWENGRLAIGLGGAIGELWWQDGLLLMMAMGPSGFAGYRCISRQL